MNLCVLTMALLKTPDNTLYHVLESIKKSKNAQCQLHMGSTRKTINFSLFDREINWGEGLIFALPILSYHMNQSVYSFCMFQKKYCLYESNFTKIKETRTIQFFNIFDKCVEYNPYHFNQFLHLSEMLCPAPHLQRQQILQFSYWYKCRISVKNIQ